MLTKEDKYTINSIIEKMQENENKRCARSCDINAGNTEYIGQRIALKHAYNAALTRLQSIINETM